LGLASCADGQAIPNGVLRPVTLEFAQVTRDLRSPEFLEATIVARKAIVADSRKRGQKSVTDDQLDQEISQMRSRFRGRNLRPLETGIRLAVNASNIRIEVNGVIGRNVLLLNPSFSLLRYGTGEIEYHTKPDVRGVAHLPFVGKSIGPISQFKSSAPTDSDNPENAPFLLLVPGPPMRLQYIPTYLENVGVTLALKSGFKLSPRMVTLISKVEDYPFGDICTKSEETTYTSFKDIASSGIAGMPTQDFPVNQITTTLAKVESPLAEAEFSIDSLIKKGDRVKVDDDPPFLYDPHGGDLLKQSKARQTALRLEVDKTKSLSRGPSSLYAAFGGLIALAGMILWYFLGRSKQK
jgi:hypothetical protein